MQKMRAERCVETDPSSSCQGVGEAAVHKEGLQRIVHDSLDFMLEGN